MYDMTNITNETQIDKIFIGLSQQESSIFILVLVFEYFLILLSGVLLNKKNTGTTNVLAYMIIAGFVTAISSFLLLGVGLIPLSVSIIFVILTIISLLIHWASTIE